MVNLAHQLIHPIHIPGNPFRLIGHGFIIREQHRRIIKPVGLFSGCHGHTCCIKRVLKNTALDMAVYCFLQRTDSLCIFHDLFHIRMADHLSRLLTFKNVMLHLFLLLIIFGRLFFIFSVLIFCIFDSLFNNDSNSSFLLIGHPIQHFLDCLFTFALIFLFGLFFLIAFHSFFLLLFRILYFSMTKENPFISVEDSFILAFSNRLTMSQHGFNKGSRICPSQNQTYFTNNAMKNVHTNLMQIIGPNAKCSYVTMKNSFLRISSGLCIIEAAACINAFIAILKNCMSKNIRNLVMLVVPN